MSPTRANQRHFSTPPAVLSGIPLDVDIRAVLPLLVDTTNIATNPSFELNTTSWAGSFGGESLVRVSTLQRRGAYCLQVNPTAGASGAFATFTGMLAGQPYSSNLDFWGPAGVAYTMAWTNTLGKTVSQSLHILGKGYWERYYIPFVPPLNDTYKLQVNRNGNAFPVPYYVDGVVVAAVSQANLGPLSYWDGDSVGFVPSRTDFYWTGVPHGSTSVMSGQSRAAGRTASLSSYGLIIMALVGLGQTPIVNQEVPLALLGGALHQRAVKQPRTFDVVGYFSGDTRIDFERSLAQLQNAINVDVVSDQEMLLQYQPLEADGKPGGETFNIRAKYVGGLEGKRENPWMENLDMKFRIYVPYVAALDGTQGTTLTVQQSLTANAIIQRKNNGVWATMGSGVVGGVVDATVKGQDNRIYVGGSFTSAGGIGNTRFIAVWDPSSQAWSALGTGAAGGTGVFGIYVTPDGSIIAVGDFTSMGGVPNTKWIAKWNGAAWSSLQTGGVGTSISNVVIDQTGNLYVAGQFSSIGGVGMNNIGFRTPAGVWTAMGSGLGGFVTPYGNTIVLSPSGQIVVGGNFATANGVSVFGVATWNGITFVSMGGGYGNTNTNTVFTLLYLPNGTLLAGGEFATMGGVTVNNIAMWNGSSWIALSTGVTGGSPTAVEFLTLLPNNTVMVTGIFNTAGGLAVSDGIALWNGSAWTYIDFRGSSAPLTSQLSGAVGSDKTIYVTTAVAGGAQVGAVTVLNNAGTANAYPVFQLSEPSGSAANGVLYMLWNATTDETIFFNLQLQPGDQLTIDLRPGRKTLTSLFRGNVYSLVLPGSVLSTWHLQPGNNNVVLFATAPGGTLPTATAWWAPVYNAIEPAIR